METCDGNNRLESMVSDFTSYLKMRVDAMKLDTVEGLAKICVGVIGLLMLSILCTLGLLMLVGVLTYLLGMAIGSMIWAVVIVAAMLILLGILMFIFRRNFSATIWLACLPVCFSRLTNITNREAAMKSKAMSRYANIDSMAKLREEQMRLTWDIKLAEQNMKSNYDDMKSKLSLSNLLSSAIGGMGSISGATTGIITTVAGTVFSLISAIRKRKRR